MMQFLNRMSENYMNNSHSGLVPKSTKAENRYNWILNQVQDDRKGEYGRSMVEMLGVLAVIGVLSIGGIATYRAAMNKHHANTLLQEANRRAVVVAGQISLTGKTPNLNEFANNDLGYARFEASVYSAKGDAFWSNVDEQFTLSIAGVSKELCQQIQENKSTAIKSFKPKVCVADENNIKLTFNNDLKVDGPCNLWATDCPSGALASGECACATAKNGEACTSHTTKQCGSGYYCRFSPTGMRNQNRGTGVCTKITATTPAANDPYLRGPLLDWWSANSWCLGNNKHLVTNQIGGRNLNVGWINRSGNCFMCQALGISGSFWTGYDVGNDSSSFYIDVYTNEEGAHHRQRHEKASALCE